MNRAERHAQPATRGRRSGPARARLVAWALALAVGAAAGCDGGGSNPPADPPPPGRRVRSIRSMKDPGGRVSWSRARNLIAFDRAGADGYYDIWVMNPDGGGESCLTCNKSALPGKHIGNPDWHPSGNFIAFQAQTRTTIGGDDVSTPGRGASNDVFVMDSAGSRFAKLTSTATTVGGVLHPHFSHSGDKLLWSERIGGGGGNYGQWALKVADFRSDTMRIDNVRTFRPGERPDFYESHGFSQNDSEIIFSGNLEQGHPETGLDVYRMNLNTGALVNLTQTRTEWDEHATLSPGGGKIVWMSSRDNRAPIFTDYWLMNADGSGKERLTFFNQQGHLDAIPGGVTAGDSSWSPDGSRFVAYVIGDASVRGGSIYMIELTGAVGETPGDSLTERSPDGDAGAASLRSGSGLPRRKAAPSRNLSELRALSDLADSMLRSGELATRLVRSDTLLPGRRHEWLTQVHRGVPVVGGELSRQTAGGQTVSMYGEVYEGLGEMDVVPALDEDAAREIVERAAGARLGPSRRPQLVVLPLDDRFALAYRVRIMSPSGIAVYFVDADTGAILRRYSDLQTQHAPPAAASAPRDSGTLVFTPIGGRSMALDTTRAPGVATFDMRGDIARTIGVVNGLVTLASPDLAVAGNAEDDVAAVDAHAHAALTYDYLARRFGQQGLGESTRIVNLVHPMPNAVSGAISSLRRLFATSAFYAGDGMVVFGDGLPDGERWEGRAWRHLSGGLDIVAHELAHAVVGTGSQLVYDGESGALNEGYADVFATGVEFAFQQAGDGPGQADYTIGEDVIVPGGLRSLAQFAAHAAPVRLGRAAGAADVHARAGVVAHAFYLAVEGGRQPASGVTVRGVGAARREDVEKVFYRAFVLMLPSNATFDTARLATGQAARDLFGPGSNVERAIGRAWTAVGVH